MIAPEQVASCLTDPHVGTVLGVKVSGLDASGTVNAIRAMVDSGECHQVCTIHSMGLVIADRDPQLKRIFNESSLVVCDGEGARWALQRQGIAVDKVPGVDLVEWICRLSSERGLRLFFYGAEPGVAELAAERLVEKYPRAQIVGALDGFHGAEHLDERLKSIKAMGIDVLLIGMGVPLQEYAARAAKDMGAATVSIGVGGSFDVLSGKRRRAPVWVQWARLEWLWRSVIDWKKLPKLPLLAVFVLKALR